MTYDEIKSSFPEQVTCIYWGVTAAEMEALTVDHWTGQTAGVWYLGTPVEIPDLAAKRMLP